MLRTRENYKKNQDRKVLQGIISKDTKECNKNHRRQKAGEQWLLDEHCSQDAQCSQEKHSCNAPFSSVFCYSFL